MNHTDKKKLQWRYAALGIVAGLLLPLGWWFISNVVDEAVVDEAIYVYLLITACSLCGAFGFKLGSYSEQVYNMADLDPLTKLMNYGSFRNMVERFLLLAIRDNHDFAILMCDIDGFKEVNVHYDHNIANDLLQEVTEILHQKTRRSDAICRYAGDNFLVCLPHVTREGAIQVSEKIREAVDARTFELRGHDIKVTMSIGLALLSQKSGASLDDIIEAAEQGAARAKTQGRNQVVLAEESQDFPRAEAF